MVSRPGNATATRGKVKVADGQYELIDAEQHHARIKTHWSSLLDLFWTCWMLCSKTKEEK